MSDSPLESEFPFKLDTLMILTGTRLEERIRNICIANDAMNVAVALNSGLGHLLTNVSPESIAVHESPLAGLEVHIPGLSVLIQALKNVRFEPIFIRFSTEMDIPPEKALIDVGLIQHFYHDIIAAQFVLFFEEHYGTMKRQCNYNYDLMHNTWKFGRRVRDAISHGGRFSIDDENFRPVTWRGYTIGRTRNGTSLGDTFKAGDLIVLMCELEKSLPMAFVGPPSPEK